MVSIVQTREITAFPKSDSKGENIDADFTKLSIRSIHVKGLDITSNIVTTQNGTRFFVDPLTNNTITGNTTFTLSSSGQYADLQFLVTGGSGTFNAEVNFADVSSEVF